MNKKHYCNNKEPIAYYYGLGGIEIYGIEHDIDDYVYCRSGISTNNLKSHRLKIYYDTNGNAFFKLGAQKVFLNECMKTNI